MRRSTRSKSSVQDRKEEEPVNKKKSAPKNASKDKKNGDKAVKEDDTDMKKSKSSMKNSKTKKPSPQKKQAEKSPCKPQDIKKVVMKGKAPVDTHFADKANYHVYNEGDTVYSSTLNQSNVNANNNKFYIIQILQHETNPNNFIFFTRWGRVGVPGMQAAIPCHDFPTARAHYSAKLRDKSQKGDYRVVEMNYDADEEEDKKEETKKDKKEEPEKESELPKRVQNLVRTIFDMKMVNNHMKQIGYDSKKMPLGKLAKSSILQGYQALKKLSEQIKKPHPNADTIAHYSNDFYSYIPHDFGFQKMSNFKLDTDKKIKTKLEMLQSLQDIQVFTKLLDEGKISSDMNELDSNYLKLNTQIKPMDKDSDLYKMLLRYVENTHASTHNQYTLEVEDIFTTEKQSETKRYTKDIGNKQLLWHGSRLTNYVGILSQGLRIAPPEAPVTGYMFGKGVYFADMVSKSANYCFTNKMNPTGLMILCQVALGNMNEKFYADYYANLLPQGKQSTKGVAKTAPKDGEYLGDVYVPLGKCGPTGVTNSALLYNEYIVYDVKQIKIKYLFKMKFHYKY